MIGLVKNWYPGKQALATRTRRPTRRSALTLELLENRENPSTLTSSILTTNYFLPYPPATPSFSASQKQPPALGSRLRLAGRYPIVTSRPAA